MLLKTFRAPDLATALAQAHAEFGPDALVLATNEFKSPQGLPAVELTVASPRAEKWGQERISPRPERSPGSSLPPTGAAEKVTDPICEALVAAGLSRDLVERFARVTQRDLAPATAARLAVAAAEAIAALVPTTDPPFAAPVVFVVGPAGAGKTTTVAKLAARAVFEARRTVIVAQSDVDRVGAIEQSAIYARHLGVEHRIVRTPDDLAAILHRANDRTTVFIDTPGIGRRDRERFSATESLRHVAPLAELVVLVPAGLHHQDAREACDRFSTLRPTIAALSRTDDGSRPGECLTAIAERRLPLGFLTTGHRVPDDLEPATPQRLAALLLRAGNPGTGANEAHK